MTRALTKEKQSYSDTFIKKVNAAREHFVNFGVLPENDELFLISSVEKGLRDASVIKLILENFYRCGKNQKYFELLSKQQSNLDKGLYIVLQDPDNIFFNSYVRALSSTPFLTLSKPLIEAYVNFRNRETLSTKDIVVLLYLCTYIGDESYYRELMNLAHDDLQFISIVKIELFRARFFNDRMGRVYDKLLSGVAPDGVEAAYFDALHLTPLHYAIMTRDEDTVQKVLEHGNWFENPAPFEDRIAGTVYDNLFEAVLIFGNTGIIREIMKKKRRRYKPLFDSIDRINNLISINEALLTRTSDEGIRGRIEDLRSMGEEIDAEIDHIVRKEIMEAAAKARLIFETRHSFACYMIKFFQDPDSIYKNAMETISSCKFFNYRNIYFVSTEDTKINLSYVKIINDEIVEKSIIFKKGASAKRSSKHKNGKYKNPFFRKTKEENDEFAGKSIHNNTVEKRRRFFTEEAHTNLNVLKKEYHALVKKYHPDVNADASSEEIIREIIEERSIILSNFCQ